MRAPTRLVVAITASLAACGEPSLAPSGSGGLSLELLAGSAALAALDSGQVLLRGPVDQTVSATPGQTVMIDGLPPGEYTVALRGFAGDAIDQYGTTAATVTAGQNTTASVSFASFVSTVTPLLPTTSTTFKVEFADVPSASSYEVQAARDPGFTTSVVTAMATGLSADVTAAQYGRHYVRVRAIDPYGGRGRPSTAQIIHVAGEDQVFDPASFTLFAGGNTEKAQTFTVGVTGTLTQIDMYIQFAATDILFDIRGTSGGAPIESNNAALYSETHPAARFTGAGFYSFPLGTDGIPVVAGQVLAIVMRGATTMSFQWNGRNDNSYPGGVWYYRGGSVPALTWTISNATFDCAFRTYVSPN